MFVSFFYCIKIEFESEMKTNKKVTKMATAAYGKVFLERLNVSNRI